MRDPWPYIAAAAIVATALGACIWLDRHTWPSHRDRRPGLLAAILAAHALETAMDRAEALERARQAREAAEADDLMALADAVREPRPARCPDCTDDWMCRVCDPWYWAALEATEGLDQ